MKARVLNLLINSRYVSVNSQVHDMANWYAGFHKHIICKEILSHGDLLTHDQGVSGIKHTRGANFTKL